jgi:hypothetical protein
VKATLSGPNTTTVVASAPCSWNTTGRYFQCNLKPPSSVQTGTTNAYLITALENVGCGFLTAPPLYHYAGGREPRDDLLQVATAPPGGPPRRASPHPLAARPVGCADRAAAPATDSTAAHSVAPPIPQLAH